jgi:predicted site-specific integrase-resolvase
MESREKMVSVGEMAELAGLSTYTLREYARDGKVPARRQGLGKRAPWRFYPARVMRVINLKCGNAVVQREAAAELAGGVKF